MTMRARGKLCLYLVSLIILILILSGCQAPYANPPESLRESDLLGEWAAHYRELGVDTIILRQDGTFKQIYIGPKAINERFETDWNKWWVERVNNGLVRLHLVGARYFAPGLDEVPTFFYDPFVQESINSPNELLLHVRVDASGRLLLHHLLINVDAGFPLFGGNTLIFRRSNEP